MAISTEITGTEPAGSQNATVERITADPTSEYVAAGPPVWYGAAQAAVRSLPRSIDDLDSEFGSELYERMTYDPQCASGLNIIKAAIIEDGPQIVTRVQDSKKDGYERAGKIADFCQTVIAEMDTPLIEVLWNLMDALYLGSKLAEQIYELDETYTGKQQLVLRALKVKPRASTQYVVDAFMNVVGILARTPENTATWTSMTVLDPEEQPNLLPRAKFVVLSNRPKDGDPRGTSLYRAAYNGWWLKMQAWPEYLKYLAQFASPSIVGTTAEGALPGDDGKSPEQALLDALLAFRNGTAIAVPYSAMVNLVFSQGDGRAFLSAFGLFDQQIAKAIVHQSLATEESQYQARAAAEVHQDVLDTIIRQMKMAIMQRLRLDVLRPLVRYNFGEKAVPLTPTLTLGDVARQDRSSLANAIAQLTTAQYLHPSQFPAIDRMMGLPERAADWESTMPQAAAAAPPAPESGIANPKPQQPAKPAAPPA